MSLSTDNLRVFLQCAQENNQSFTSLFSGRPISGGLGHRVLSKRNRAGFFFFLFLTDGRARAVRHMYCHLLPPLCRIQTAGRSRVTPGYQWSTVTEYVYSTLSSDTILSLYTSTLLHFLGGYCCYSITFFL